MRRAFILGVVGAVLATSTAWAVAARARTPAQRAVQASPPPPSLVTARVTAGPLVDELTLDGRLARADTTTVRGAAGVPAGAARAVVTRLPVRAGATVTFGTVLVEVSGRPLIVLPGQFPAYRDLSVGATGTDVRQLQRALRSRYGTPETGTFDARTERDVRRLYAAAGAPPALADQPPATAASPAPAPVAMLPMSEVLFVAALPALVQAVHVSVGADASGALVTLASGGWRVVAEVDERAGLPSSARVVFGDGPLSGRPGRLVEVRRGADASTPSPPQALFEVDGAVEATIGAAQRVRIERARSADGTVVVPVSALWTAVDGTVNVTVVVGSARRLVPVDVTLTVAGQAAVRGELAVGAEVLVGYSHGS